ncbi:MAG: hypothetical protein QGG84_09505, partial [Rhodospirillales bacterium]|nr:hypothetical protein [Rhodospirillales bacterium]
GKLRTVPVLYHRVSDLSLTISLVRRAREDTFCGSNENHGHAKAGGRNHGLLSALCETDRKDKHPSPL